MDKLLLSDTTMSAVTQKGADSYFPETTNLLLTTSNL